MVATAPSASHRDISLFYSFFRLSGVFACYWYKLHWNCLGNSQFSYVYVKHVLGLTQTYYSVYYTDRKLHWQSVDYIPPRPASNRQGSQKQAWTLNDRTGERTCMGYRVCDIFVKDLFVSHVVLAMTRECQCKPTQWSLECGLTESQHLSYIKSLFDAAPILNQPHIGAQRPLDVWMSIWSSSGKIAYWRLF